MLVTWHTEENGGRTCDIGLVGDDLDQLREQVRSDTGYVVSLRDRNGRPCDAVRIFWGATARDVISKMPKPNEIRIVSRAELGLDDDASEEEVGAALLAQLEKEAGDPRL